MVIISFSDRTSHFILLHHKLWLKLLMLIGIHLSFMQSKVSPWVAFWKIFHSSYQGKRNDFWLAIFSVPFSVAADDLVFSSQKDDAGDTTKTTLTDVSSSFYFYLLILVCHRKRNITVMMVCKRHCQKSRNRTSNFILCS